MTIQSILTPRNAFILALLAAIGALGAALVAQFVFDLKPCILCLYARVPYVAIIVVAAVALMRPEKEEPIFLILLMALFLAAFGVAFFHTGVEQHWWELSGGCPIEKSDAQSSEDMLKQILATPMAPCDKVAWRLMGVSIVIWNAVFSWVMHDIMVIAFILRVKKKTP